MKKKVFVLGATGRMGQALIRSFPEFADLEPWGYLSRKSDLVASFKNKVVSLKEKELAESDVWVDFTLPDLFEEVLNAAVFFKKPLISGVTGISAEQKNKMKQASGQIPILWSSNMSLGIAVLKKALEVCQHLSGFDFQIEEFHHNQKKDNPSGTAISLQEKLDLSTGKKNPPPVGIRGGSIFGVHKVWMMGPSETLCFEHQALDREGFARGALKAATWLTQKKPGLYTLEDLILK